MVFMDRPVKPNVPGALEQCTRLQTKTLRLVSHVTEPLMCRRRDLERPRREQVLPSVCIKVPHLEHEKKLHILDKTR